MAYSEEIKTNDFKESTIQSLKLSELKTSLLKSKEVTDTTQKDLFNIKKEAVLLKLDDLQKQPRETLKKSHEWSLTIQMAMKMLGYYDTSTRGSQIDGIYGDNTATAVKAFQTDWNTTYNNSDVKFKKVDGIAKPNVIVRIITELKTKESPILLLPTLPISTENSTNSIKNLNDKSYEINIGKDKYTLKEGGILSKDNKWISIYNEKCVADYLRKNISQLSFQILNKSSVNSQSLFEQLFGVSFMKNTIEIIRKSLSYKKETNKDNFHFFNAYILHQSIDGVGTNNTLINTILSIYNTSKDTQELFNTYRNKTGSGLLFDLYNDNVDKLDIYLSRRLQFKNRSLNSEIIRSLATKNDQSFFLDKMPKVRLLLKNIIIEGPEPGTDKIDNNKINAFLNNN